MALKDFRTADSGGIKYIWRQVVNELFNLSSQLMSWATDMFVQSINGKSGSSITIVKDDVGLGNVDNTADKDKHVAHSGTADNADKLDGKHADDFMLKSKHDDFESVIATALNDLEERKAEVSDLADYEVTVTESGASGNTIKSYVISQGGSTIGTINIPKDLVVSSGSVVVGNWVDGVFTEDVSGTGKAVKLVIANQTDPIYINVQDLVDVYTAAKGATEIQIAISKTNEISATLVKSVRDKIDNAIPKVSGATGKVAKFKSDGSLESSSFEIKKSVPDDAVFTDHQTDKVGHYIPTANEKALSPDTSVLRDPARDMAFVGAVHEDEKGHVVSVETVAILALTNAEIQAIIDQATAEMAAEMA